MSAGNESEGPLALLRLDSIRNRILMLALLATLVPALSTAALSYVRTRGALTETLEGELRGIGSQSARELDLWTKERFYDLRVFVGSFEVTENLDRIEAGGPEREDGLARLTEYLSVVQSRSGAYEELVAFDASGAPIASSRELRPEPLPDSWVEPLSRGATRLGTPYWDDALGEVVAPIAVPITSADARFQGALRATMAFDAVSEILLELQPGAEGEVVLLAGDGRVIAASHPIVGFEPALDASTLAALTAGEAETLEYTNPEGAEMVGTLRAVPQVDWAVLVQLPTADAFAPITRLRNSTFLLVSVLLVLVGAAAYFIGLFIVRPLDRLTHGAAQVAGGDLSVDLPVTSTDEVGSLTRVFNAMVGQLRASREELDEANEALRSQNAELERISMTDSLTSLFNRRYLMREFTRELQRASRHDRRLAVLMMDVDRFKSYNDENGHQAGDDVLRGMGRVVVDATREGDVPARYGGEEFTVLLPDCDIDGAIDAAERIRARLAEEVFAGGRVTVSIGASAFPTHGDSPEALIASADTALYAAKEAGRDRVMPAVDPANVTGSEPSGPAGRRSPDEKKKAVAGDEPAEASKRRAGSRRKTTAANPPASKAAGGKERPRKKVPGKKKPKKKDDPTAT